MPQGLAAGATIAVLVVVSGRLDLAARHRVWGCPRRGDDTSEFSVDRSRLAATGRNPFFVLEPGYELHLEAGTRSS